MNAAAGWNVPPAHVSSAAKQIDATEALWRRVAAGELGATLRWYSYAGTALVLGVGQAQEVADAAACHAAGVEVVKRSSGGTVVLATPSLLALDLALPADHPMAGHDVVAAYRWLGEAFSKALRELAPGRAGDLRVVGVEEARADQQAQRTAAAPAAMAAAGAAAKSGSIGRAWHAGSETAAALRGLACFGVLSPYEVVLAAGGGPPQKLVGLSQLRKRGVVLFQAGVYARFAGDDLARYLALPPGARPALAAELDRRVASLAALGLSDTAVPALMERLSRWLSARE